MQSATGRSSSALQRPGRRTEPARSSHRIGRVVGTSPRLLEPAQHHPGPNGCCSARSAGAGISRGSRRPVGPAADRSRAARCRNLRNQSRPHPTTRLRPAAGATQPPGRPRHTRLDQWPDSTAWLSPTSMAPCPPCDCSSSVFVTGAMRSSKNQLDSSARARCPAEMRPLASGRIMSGL
jgi:hypothetical protein